MRLSVVGSPGVWGRDLTRGHGRVSVCRSHPCGNQTTRIVTLHTATISDTAVESATRKWCVYLFRHPYAGRTRADAVNDRGGEPERRTVRLHPLLVSDVAGLRYCRMSCCSTVLQVRLHGPVLRFDSQADCVRKIYWCGARERMEDSSRIRSPRREPARLRTRRGGRQSWTSSAWSALQDASIRRAPARTQSGRRRPVNGRGGGS